MPYDFLDDIAIADIAFEAWGETKEAMFVSAADATMNVMVADLQTIARREERKISLKAEKLDMLLFEFLQELIFYKDAEMLLLRVEVVKIRNDDDICFVSANAYGEKIDPEKHDLIVDVKAVTLHKFKVEHTQRGWETLVVLDI
jgi:SHS2 domain-containing protein